MMTKVKICGLKRPEDVGFVNEALPDYAGFIFYEKSSRCVTAGQAASLSAVLDRRVLPVGVFVNSQVSFIVELARRQTIRQVQLHGDEDAAFVRNLKRELAAAGLAAVPVVKSVAVKDAASLSGLDAYPCDMFLFDTYTPGYGGSGRRFDLKLLAGRLPDKPYFIAGGLDADNVAEVIRQARPFAVDTCGGVETGGVKDREKVLAFVREARRAQKINDQEEKQHV